MLSRLFGSLKKIFGYRFSSVEVLKERGSQKKRSFFGSSPSNLDLDLQFTYSPKYGIHVRAHSDKPIPILNELQKGFDRTMSQCSNLKSILTGYLEDSLLVSGSSDKIVFCFDKQNTLVLLSDFPKSFAKMVPKDKVFNLDGKLELDCLFKSQILKDYIHHRVSKLKAQKYGVPIANHPNATIKLNYSGANNSYKGFYLAIDSQTLCILEGDPQGILEETKTLFESAKPHVRNLRHFRRKKIGYFSSEEAGLERISSDISMPDVYIMPSTDQANLIIEEMSANIKKNVQDKVDAQKKAKIWSLRQTMRNLSNDSIEINLREVSKNTDRTHQLMGLREIGKSYAMEYFPNGFTDSGNNRYSINSDRLLSNLEKQNEKEGSRLSFCISRPSILDTSQNSDEIMHLSNQLSDDNLNDWNFDLLKINQLQELALVVRLFSPYLCYFGVDNNLFLNFSYALKRKYNKNENPFHNFKHGVAVAFSANYFLKKMPHIEENYNLTVQFGFLVAALGHDVGHTGRNNNYEINSRSKLALRYNDRSPLEQHHISKLFAIIFKHKLNIFESIGPEVFNDIRHIIIECILATDMKVHFTLLSKFESIINKNEAVVSKDFKELVLCILIHAADISASTRKVPIATEWSRLVSIEFTNQYNLEVEQSLPVTAYFKDLHVPLNFYKSECGFLNFIVKPLFNALRNYNFDMEETQDSKNNAHLVIPSRSKHVDYQSLPENPFKKIMELIEENVKFYESKIAAINVDNAN